MAKKLTMAKEVYEKLKENNLLTTIPCKFKPKNISRYVTVVKYAKGK